jgi:hypothetical protein
MLKHGVTIDARLTSCQINGGDADCAMPMASKICVKTTSRT